MILELSAVPQSTLLAGKGSWPSDKPGMLGAVGLGQVDGAAAPAHAGPLRQFHPLTWSCSTALPPVSCSCQKAPRSPACPPRLGSLTLLAPAHPPSSSPPRGEHSSELGNSWEGERCQGERAGHVLLRHPNASSDGCSVRLRASPTTRGFCAQSIDMVPPRSHPRHLILE